MKHCLFILSILFVCIACKRETNVERNMKKLYGKEILLPEFDEHLFFGTERTWDSFPEAEVKLVVYYDSTVCTNCKVSELWNWEKVVLFSETLEYRFQPLFIFNPPLEKVGEIYEALYANPFAFPIHLDYDRKFFNLNKDVLPERSFYHTFLLDQNNRVVLIGDPLLNEELWELYQKKINTLLETDNK